MTTPHHTRTEGSIIADTLDLAAGETTRWGARLRAALSESAIYGVLVVSALIIVTGQKSDASWEIFLKVLGAIIVFWIAHIFAVVVSHLGLAVGGDKSFGALLLYGARHANGLLLGSLVPLSVILLGAVGALSDDAAVWAALWIDVALLGIIGYVSVARMTQKRWARLLGTTVTSLLGVAIMMLKAFIH